MYLKGYKISTANSNQIITLPKWDFGGDKPWTNGSWKRTLTSIRKIDEFNYPLLILDLDNSNDQGIQIKDKADFENWLNLVMK